MEEGGKGLFRALLPEAQSMGRSHRHFSSLWKRTY